jgi:putative addiction module component (TIGR02574 family)
MKIDIADLFKLSAAERIQLAEDLWDSVASDPDSLPPLSGEEQAEINRRIADHEQNRSTALNWADVRARLWSRLK